MIKNLYFLMFLGTVTLHASFSVSSHAAEEAKQIVMENQILRLRLIPRTPVQMAAFYEARGFPKDALPLFKNTCFITVSGLNKSQEIVWLELRHWRFTTTKGPLQRLDRNYWHKQWQQLNLAQSHRSTFGWTLLPETRDLQPNEPVGGNIVLPLIDDTFAVEARFMTGAKKRGKEVLVQFDKLHCARDEATP